MNDTEITEELMRHIQSFISTDSLLFIGSGISVAEGIAGMPKLGDTLKQLVPNKINESDNKLNLQKKWKKIDEGLSSGAGLESVLLKEIGDISGTNDELLNMIKDVSWLLIFRNDQQVLDDLLYSDRTLRLTKFIKRFNYDNDQLFIITTNYDRLIEYALDDLNITVNTLFSDGALPRFDKNSALKRDQNYIVSKNKLRPQKRYAYALLLKPHGSISWMENKKNGSIVSSLSLSNKSPCIITPGGTKYQQGYKFPFNEIIPLMNDQINSKSQYIFLGYGFNDAHLENQLREPTNRKKPWLIITKSFPDNHEILDQLDDYVLIKQSTGITKGSTVIYKKNNILKKYETEDELWDIQCLTEKILW